MTISTVVKLDREEKEALRIAVNVLHNIVNDPCVSNQYSSVYYSGGYFDHLDFENLSEMEEMLDDLANAEDLELEP